MYTTTIIYHRPMMRSIRIFSSLFLIGCFSAQFNLTFGAGGCKHRDYGHGSTVCVCNEHYCDSLEPIRKTAPGVVQTYSTSRDGDRLAREDLHFTNATGSLGSNDRRVIRLQLPTDPKVNRIIGFGGALSDATGYNFVQLSPKLRENLIRDYFGDHGIEYSSIRVTIGGSDMSTREYSDDDHDGDDFDLEHFQLQPEDLKYKIPFLKMAQQATPQHRPLKLFGSAWSAPAWMKTNHKLDHGGRIKGEPGGKYYRAFARYLLKFLREYQQRNVTQWWGMTVVNEPGKFQYNSLEMSAEQQRDFIKKDLGPELHREGMDKIQVMIYDWNIPGMKQFAHTVLSDPEAAKYVAGIAYHWYATNDQNRPELKQIHQEWPQKFILATEACEGFGGDSLGVWHVAQHYAQDVLGSLKNYVTGWVDWNLAVDMHGGPSWVNQHLVAPVIVNADGHEYYKQPAFYVLGHFSKFLPPDSVHMHYTGSSNHPNYDLIAFQRPDGGRVMVILNVGDKPEDFSINDPDHGTVNVQVKGQSIKTLLWY